MVNGQRKNLRFLWTLAPCAAVLILAAWLRGAEYDEQYTLFLTAGVPRPDWPSTAFPAGLARAFQSGDASLISIARDLRVTDVHPPLYFWLVSLWRMVVGHSLFAARLLSVLLALGALALTGMIARQASAPPVRAMLLTLGCYGFAYTSVVARGFALADLLLLAGIACLLSGGRPWRYAMAGGLLGAATFSNYLAVFTAGAVLLVIGLNCLRRDIPLARVWVARPKEGHRGTRWNRPHRPGGVRQCQAAPPLTQIARSANNLFSVALAVLRPSSVLKYLPAAAQAPGATGGNDCRPASPARFLALLAGFLLFLQADLWWFLAQRGSRPGQFPPFSLILGLSRLAARFAGAIVGGLPLYLDGTASTFLAVALGLLLASLAVCIFWRWRAIATRRTRILFAAAALAPPAGLFLLGFVFNNTPIEVRYLAFSTPFAGLLLAGALGSRGMAVILTIQAASVAGLMLAPQTMQPARAAAHAAADLVQDGVVLLPRGNDGVGVVGAFAIESPPALPLLLIGASDTPDLVRARVAAWHRVVLALLEQDDASRAASITMRRALAGWREVARGPNVAVYERGD